MAELTGRCLCGQVTWSAPGPMKWAAYCHCESCRRATSAPLAAWFGVCDTGLEWGGPLVVFHSSPEVERGHCGTCGAPMFYRNTARWPGETHLLASSLNDPSAYTPTAHVFYGERLPWVVMRDGLPKYMTTGDDGCRPLTDDEIQG